MTDDMDPVSEALWRAQEKRNDRYDTMLLEHQEHKRRWGSQDKKNTEYMRLHDKLVGRIEKCEVNVLKLEKRVSYWAGAAAGIGALLGTVASAVLGYLLQS